MSTNRTLTLHTLPVELIYCILDNLDDLTIILSLRNVCLQLNAIIDIYPRYQTLTTLNLAHNRVGAIGTQHLALVLRNNNSMLTMLDLDWNYLGDEGIRYLASQTENKAYTTIPIFENITGVLRFSGRCYNPENTTKTLGVRNALTTLNLRGNNISAIGAKYLGHAIQNNTTLTTLNLDINSIGDEGVQHLALALQNNTTLTTLSLQINNIRAEGAHYLAIALQCNQTLTTLNLQNNCILEEGARYLINALRSNNTLTMLNLQHTDIRPRHEQRFINADNHILAIIHF
ncbi:unnamed protein product [Adineta steineri]|uniref:F-box domain-containing protein n=1 Tax=Adineta steineri TaxID=433720 RepID=A0A814R1U6_9BILA|nr:unnamed protein product [Adineta steineri]CAF1468880.1 unnamed protein product [Adineta steineri]CAF1469395.1 unnamed protein product [Adineta steineri]